ncbi:MAG: hypothetical protein IAG13_26145 [Deltaproteobacteria bacterium]|nr:hypothetical protein [Nannocystaceae bacterium]
MSARGPDPEHDPELDALLGSVCESVDHELRHAPVTWDFAAVLARAHAMDPTQVDADDVREAELAAPVVSLAHERRRRPTHDDPAFQRLIADVRADAEHDAALRMHGVAAMPPRAEVRPLRSMLVGALAMAAMLVLGVGLLEGVRYVQQQRDAAPDEALHQGEVDAQRHERAEVEEGGERAERPRARPAPTSATTIPSEPAPLEPITLAPAPKRVAKPSVHKPKPKQVGAAPLPSLAERIAAIDAEAHAAWKARDYARAQSSFEALIELAGDSRLADLAYGDLFTLAHRTGDADRELALWKRYLARFPDGRFADDARAGLCRRAAGDARAACWRGYLDDFPGGSFRAQAERESSDGT